MIVDNKFDIKQIVYLKTDIEQSPRIIRSFQVYQTKISYQLCLGANDSWHEEFEISEEQNNTKPQVNGFVK